MRRYFIVAGILSISVLSMMSYGCSNKTVVNKTLSEYTDYFKSVYDIFDKNYYLPVNKEAYDRFLEAFKLKIFPQVKDKTKLDESVKQTGTGIMVTQFLKDPSDPFTNFFPPQLVKQLKESSLGYGSDIGIEGSFKDNRYIISQVEPRSDAFKKGVSIGDEIIKIEDKAISDIPEDMIAKIFSPPENQEVSLEIVSNKTASSYKVKLASTKYFKQSIFNVVTPDPKVACFKIKFFNEETGNDFRGMIDTLNKNNINKLIIDLRDNGGGPPLAAWDMSGVFLDPDQKLFYFQKRDTPAMGLVATASKVRYNGSMAVIINKGTGSAAELLSGIMQAYNRAKIIGENSAGQVYLKSFFDLSDGATIQLTVAKGFLFNGNPIDKDGLKPDAVMTDPKNIISYAVDLLNK